MERWNYGNSLNYQVIIISNIPLFLPMAIGSNKLHKHIIWLMILSKLLSSEFRIRKLPDEAIFQK